MGWLHGARAPVAKKNTNNKNCVSAKASELAAQPVACNNIQNKWHDAWSRRATHGVRRNIVHISR
eukprot:4604802-Lingulodinium_polyedra.AAC.1